MKMATQVETSTQTRPAGARMWMDTLQDIFSVRLSQSNKLNELSPGGHVSFWC